MTIYVYDDLAPNQSIAFDPAQDVLQFQDPNIQAGHLLLRLQLDGSLSVKPDYGDYEEHSYVVLLQSVSPEQLSSANFTFATGGLVLVGDNDTLTGGDSSANFLTGTANGDFFMGLGGNDTLVGGDGDDLFSYQGGSSGADYGDDSVSGGNGFDWIILAGTPLFLPSSGVIANLEAGTASGMYPGSIAFTSIEGIATGSFGDSLVGSSAANEFDPVGGDDTVNGAGGNDTILGYSGNDRFDGGDDIDTVLYVEDPDGVLVDLAAGTAVDGWGDTDTLIAIENIVGSDYDDQIYGDSGANLILGGAGDDTLNGGTGDDSIDGGFGFDQAVFSGMKDDYVVTSLGAGNYSVVGADGTDTVSGVERLVFDDGTQALSVSYTFSAVPDGTAFYFDPALDVLNVDGGLSAVDLDVEEIEDGPDAGRGIIFTDFAVSNKSITLLYTPAADPLNLYKIASSNIVFQDGSLLLVGDNTVGVGDDGGNASLIGGAGDDLLASFGGSQALIGGDGNDVMVTLGGQSGGSGTDAFIGGSGIDSLILNDVIGLTGYTVNLDTGTGTVSGANPSGFTVTGIENLFFEADGATANLTGDLNSNELRGGDGNDTIDGGAGADSIDGGEGDDSLLGGTGNDLVQGGLGNDVLHGNVGADTLVGDDGADQLFGDNGNDTIAGGLGADNVNGNNGFDTIDGGAGNDTLHGGTEFDVLSGGDDDDQVFGDKGNDTLDGGAGNDNVLGGIGNDWLAGGAGTDTLDGGTEVDTADYRSAPGAATVDLLLGTAASDGWGFSDTLALVENVTGSAFNDTLTGDGNANVLDGGAGDDSLSGGAGNDLVQGGLGNDVLHGNVGVDTLVGDAGDDTLLGDNGNDSIAAGSGDDNINGNNGFDTIDGGDGNDFIHGGLNGDIITGGDGNDQLFGDLGDDTVAGGTGDDTLAGGAGNDLFRYDAASLNTGDVTANGIDVINGAAAGDLIGLLGLNDELQIGGVALDALSSDAILGGALSAGTSVAFAGGVLQIDVNLDGAFIAADDFQITLTGVTTVTYNATDDLFHLA